MICSVWIQETFKLWEPKSVSRALGLQRLGVKAADYFMYFMYLLSVGIPEGMYEFILLYNFCVDTFY